MKERHSQARANHFAFRSGMHIDASPDASPDAHRCDRKRHRIHRLERQRQRLHLLEPRCWVVRCAQRTRTRAEGERDRGGAQGGGATHGRDINGGFRGHTHTHTTRARAYTHTQTHKHRHRHTTHTHSHRHRLHRQSPRCPSWWNPRKSVGVFESRPNGRPHCRPNCRQYPQSRSHMAAKALWMRLPAPAIPSAELPGDSEDHLLQLRW